MPKKRINQWLIRTVKTDLVLRLVNTIRPVIPSNRVLYEGLVFTIAAVDKRKGATVVTPDGLGEIISLIPNFITKKPEFAEVYLYRGYIKRYKVLLLNQYAVMHKPTGQFVLLSPTQYRYIYMQEQLIEYRITNRRYATLSDKSKAEYEYVNKLNKNRYGLHFLRSILRYNLVIKKKDKK